MSSPADARPPHASADRDDFIVVPVSGGTPHHALDQLERQLRRFAFNLHDGPLQSCAMAETILGRAESTSEVDRPAIAVQGWAGLPGWLIPLCFCLSFRGQFRSC